MVICGNKHRIWMTLIILGLSLEYTIPQNRWTSVLHVEPRVSSFNTVWLTHNNKDSVLDLPVRINIRLAIKNHSLSSILSSPSFAYILFIITWYLLICYSSNTTCYYRYQRYTFNKFILNITYQPFRA